MSYTVINEPLRTNESDRRLLRGLARYQRVQKVAVLRAAWRKFKRITGRDVAPTEHPAPKVGNMVVVFRHVFISEDRSRFPQKSRPAGFDHLKCFGNLIETVKGSRHAQRVRIVVYYNGTLEQLRQDRFESALLATDLNIEVKLLTATSAVEAVLMMFRGVREMPLAHDDIVYLLENDYLHQPDWVDEVFEAYHALPWLEYVSLYDHPDRYKFPHRFNKSTLYVTGTRHWISTPVTCGTFLVKFGALMRDFKCLYSTKNDNQMFLELTQKLKRTLLTPVPGLAVHCMTEHLDPIQRIEKTLLEK